MSLATKYRPTTFSDVVGQTSTIMVLKKQIQADKIKNCYIFEGASGCGKTTMARIFASELNGMQDSAIEIDAASNNGVDNVRNIINSANEHSVLSKYKIIIMDEAHMLSTQAWNALLKTIEEPPKYTIFIFCTTNAEKIPATVVNRCQRFKFTKVPSVLINERLDYICRQEGFTNFEASCDYISKNCNNQLRDAITLLEQVADVDTNLDFDITLSLVGNTNYMNIFTIIDYMIDGNEAKLIEAIEDTILVSVTNKQFVKQLLEVELDINKYITLGNLSYCTTPVTYENTIKNMINFDNAKQLHSYFLKNILELYNFNDLTKEVITASLLRLARLE